MIIYGDILFILNLTIDYLLITLTAVILKINTSLLRQLIASVLAGLSSFYIFIESKSVIIDLLYRFAVAVIIWAVVMGSKYRKKILKAVCVYFTIGVLLSGAVIFIANTFSVAGLAVNNTFFYVGISPIMLITLSVIFYFSVKLVYRVRRNYKAIKFCDVKITLNENHAQYSALIDSGNSISDILTDSEILISSEKVVKDLTGVDSSSIFSNEGLKKRCRLIPAGTVSGETVLPAIRCDKAEIFCNQNIYELKRPIIAISKHINSEDYDIIISQGVLEGR